MNLWRDLKAIDHYTNGAKIDTIRAIVEIPKGSILKYEYEPSGRYLTIVREMKKRYRYPFNYGIIPQTLAGDEDPLDAIIIYDQPIPAGTVVNCKIYGVIRMIDNGQEDDKILCIPYFGLNKKVNLKKICYYLDHYKSPYQEGTVTVGIEGYKEAEKTVNGSIKRFKERYL